MSSKNQLISSMWIFTTIIVILFSIIIINEKKYIFLEEKIEKRLISYINNHYKEIKNNLIVKKIKYSQKDYSYRIKLCHKENKNLYFYVIYKKKKISSTYKKDYVEGNSLLSYYQKTFEKELNKGRKSKTTIVFSKSLDHYTNDVYEKILQNQIKDLPIYKIKTELKPSSFQEDVITTAIKDYYKELSLLGYHAKSIEFTFLFDDISQSFTLKNMTNELINNNTKEIISGIINRDEDIMKQYPIIYKYIY